jgi:hypothetical protein
MIEFILGTLFGFGAFMLTHFLAGRELNDTTKTINGLLDSKFKERFKDE